MRHEDEQSEFQERADQWAAGGTAPDADETWSIPIDDPDATVPLRPHRDERA